MCIPGIYCLLGVQSRSTVPVYEVWYDSVQKTEKERSSQLPRLPRKRNDCGQWATKKEVIVTHRHADSETDVFGLYTRTGGSPYSMPPNSGNCVYHPRLHGA